GIGCTSVSDPDLVYLEHFGQPQLPLARQKMMAATAPAPTPPAEDVLAVPSYLRNRQIPLELIEEEYAKKHLRSDLQPDL
ncbi:MAG TPA: hypothetical protein PLL88_09940, partial [Anaerolineaceae bacterium]|nr:hypothetical protein [Anaerolineaceae bacterium]